MKSLLLKLAGALVVIGLFVFVYGEVRGADWRLYGEDDLGGYYYDAASIAHPSKGIVRVRGKTVYTEKGVIDLVARFEEKFRDLNHSMFLSEFDCVNKKIKTLELVDYSKNGSISSSHSYQNARWRNMLPDSTTEKLYNTVCK